LEATINAYRVSATSQSIEKEESTQAVSSAHNACYGFNVDGMNGEQQGSQSGSWHQ
jgi:hypothetical protein